MCSMICLQDLYLLIVFIAQIALDLRNLYIKYKEFGSQGRGVLDRKDRYHFLSKVTRFVAFERMSPEIQVYIPSYMEAGQEIDDETLDWDRSENGDVDDENI